MNDDDLRIRLAASNPTPPSEPVDPIDSDRARLLMENIMSSTTQTSSGKRAARIFGVAATFLVLAVGGTALLGGGDSKPPLALTASGGDPMAMCMVFDVNTLAEMSPAFAGTVTELTDSVATLKVDRWFTGGDAETVTIAYTAGFEALIGTPTLEVGQRYLITAAEGVVNGCGYSGVATPEYEAAFEAAFGA